jgi:hypothetical protein
MHTHTHVHTHNRYYSNLYEYQQKQWVGNALKMREDFINGSKFDEHYQRYTRDPLEQEQKQSTDPRKIPLKNGIFFSCATDGLGLGDRSELSVTPIFLRILNFPPWLRVRFLACLMPLILPLSRECENITGGKRGWPTYNPCLNLLVNELDDLFKNGFEVEYEGQKEWYYCYLMFVANDLMALPRVLGCPFPTAQAHGCHMCQVKGVASATSKYPSSVPVKPDAVRHFIEADMDRKCVHTFKGKSITRRQLVAAYTAALSHDQKDAVVKKTKTPFSKYCTGLVGKAPPAPMTHEDYEREGKRTEAELKRRQDEELKRHQQSPHTAERKVPYPDKEDFPITCVCVFARLEGFDVVRDNIMCTMHWGSHLGGVYLINV